MKTFFSSNGPLARHLDGYEPRDDQALMAQAVADLLASPEQGVPGMPDYAKILVIEAETGIGKSLAYLVPAILSGKRVVVSTATINLQDQLIDKEVPVLERILETDIEALCVKGRQNYLCLHRWYQYRSTPQLSLVDNEQCGLIETWLAETESGDRAELDWLSDRSPLWPRISAQSHQCLGGECPEHSSCFVNRLRKKAGTARLLIVNHHLYFSDLALRERGYGELLPRHEVVVFDEAHHLERVATTFFGTAFSQYQVYDLASDVIQQAESELPPDRAERLIDSSRGLRQRVDRFAALFPPQRGRFNLAGFIAEQDDWPGEIQLVADGLQRLAEEAAGLAAGQESWRVLEERARELSANLRFAGLPDPGAESAAHVHWFERRERAVSLSATPVEVAEDLRRTLYAHVPNCLLTSATLSSGDRFDYICQRLGLPEETTVLQFKSPFDYRRRTLLYVPDNGFPQPASPGYETALCGRVEDLLQASRGRALVLFTSFKGMDTVADYLQGRLVYPVLVQGSASRAKLLERFRTEKDTVLLAVASFWEGVDIAGESLSAVIIDKLPFEVPSDPVVQARMQAISEKGGNPFFQFQVPRAVLTLRQGVGRLMRSGRDYGLIAVMDTRLFTKRYGAIFLQSLPPSPLVRNLDDVAAFFAAMTTEKQ